MSFPGGVVWFTCWGWVFGWRWEWWFIYLYWVSEWVLFRGVKETMQAAEEKASDETRRVFSPTSLLLKLLEKCFPHFPLPSLWVLQQTLDTWCTFLRPHRCMPSHVSLGGFSSPTVRIKHISPLSFHFYFQFLEFIHLEPFLKKKKFCSSGLAQCLI